jgi:thiol-disulfide isomerase/thioredoxin
MENQMVEETGGKKHKKTRRNEPKIIVVKVYADWCGHCTSLKPEWDRVKKIVPMHKVQFVEINEKHKAAAIPAFNSMHGVMLPEPQGYPTIARFGPDKQIEYYNGERTAKPLAKWALNGGQGTEGGSKKKRRNRTAKKRRGTRKNGLFGWLKW